MMMIDDGLFMIKYHNQYIHAFVAYKAMTANHVLVFS